MLTDMDPPPAEGNFCDDSNRPVKPHIVERYNRHMSFFDISDRMANSYSMDRRNLKWTTKLFFHVLDLTVLNSWILLSSCGAQYTHRDFRLLLVRNLNGRQGVAAANIVWFESHHNQHWPAKSTQVRCHVCSSHGQRKTTVYKCAKCDVGLCVVPCFGDYHINMNL